MQYSDLHNSQQHPHLLFRPSQDRILPLESIPFIHDRIPNPSVAFRDLDERFVMNQVGVFRRKEREFWRGERVDRAEEGGELVRLGREDLRSQGGKMRERCLWCGRQ